MAGLAKGIGSGVRIPVQAMIEVSDRLSGTALLEADLLAGASTPAGGAQGMTMHNWGGLHLYGIQDARALLEELQALAG